MDWKGSASMVSSTRQYLSNGRPAPSELDDQVENAQSLLMHLQRGTRAPPNVEAGWERFHALATRLIRGVVVRSGAPRGHLEDLVQEVWAHVLRKLPAFRPRGPGSVGGWIRKITHCAAARHCRNAIRCKDAPTVPANLDAVPGDGSEPPDIAERREDFELIHEAIERIFPKIPWQWWAVLQFHILGNFRAAAVAAPMGVTEAWVWDVARRLRQRIAAEIAELRGGGDKRAVGTSKHTISLPGTSARGSTTE